MAAAKKKKKSLRLILLLLVVIALGAVYFLIDDSEGEELEITPAPTMAAENSKLVLCTLSQEDVVKVSFENDHFSATVAKQEDGTYLFEEEPDFPIDQTKAGHVFNNLFKESELLLENADVAIVPGSAFCSEGFCRLSYATSMEHCMEGLNRIEAFINELTDTPW